MTLGDGMSVIEAMLIMARYELDQRMEDEDMWLAANAKIVNDGKILDERRLVDVGGYDL